MRKPTIAEILGMTGDQLDYLLNQCLIPLFAEHRMGDRSRHYSVNPVDAGDAKIILRRLGLKTLSGEFDDGFAAVFARRITPGTAFRVRGETSEELAVARAALLALLEETDLLKD